MKEQKQNYSLRWDEELGIYVKVFDAEKVPSEKRKTSRKYVPMKERDEKRANSRTGVRLSLVNAYDAAAHYGTQQKEHTDDAERVTTHSEHDDTFTALRKARATFNRYRR